MKTTKEIRFVNENKVYIVPIGTDIIEDDDKYLLEYTFEDGIKYICDCYIDDLKLINKTIEQLLEDIYQHLEFNFKKELEKLSFDEAFNILKNSPQKDKMKLLISELKTYNYDKVSDMGDLGNEIGFFIWKYFSKK